MSKDYVYLLEVLSSKLQVENWDEKSKSLNTVCPFCGKPNYHFAVNLQKGVYNCFKCQCKGHVYQLLRYLGIQIVDTPIRDSDSLNSVFELFKPGKVNHQSKSHIITEYFKSISEPLRPAHSWYLQSRGITGYWSNYYGIRSGKTGSQLSNYVLIPDNPNEVHYYTARSISGGLRYINPPSNISEVGGNIFNLRDPITDTVILAEGVFTAIAINRYLNKSLAVALYGKLFKQKQLVTLLSKGVKSAIICFDADAYEDSFKWCEKLNNMDIKVSIVRIPPIMGLHTDVADLSQSQFMECFRKMEPYNRFSTLNTLKEVL